MNRESGKKKNINKHRTLTQVLFSIFTNSNVVGFVDGKIYKGNTKLACVPGLNCYSCPGALGSCPIGSLQAVIADRNHSISFYIIGIILLFGVTLGRFICGWLCPFGLIQDLINKIPFTKKIKTFRLDKQLRYIKYIILVLFVVLLPMLVVDIIGQGKPWFCAYICPSGTLFGGIPLIASTPILRESLSWLFTWKVTILVILIILSIIIYRPFCKYLCPLGAMYGMFNRVAFYKFTINNTKCSKCNACSNICPMGIDVLHNPNSVECIRCGKCRDACGNKAIELSKFITTNLIKS